MKSIESLINIAECISAQFGNNTEVVIHDFSQGYDKTIVHIENGHVTGRKVGGCPTTLFLEEIKRNEHIEKNFRYITHTPDGKTLRSSTVNFYEEDKLTGSICINQDITDLIALERVIQNMSSNNYFETRNEKNEMFSSSISEMLESFIAEGLAKVGVPVAGMNKESKIQFISFLDNKGVFLIQKSGVRICELLGISKFTLYNYLDEIRK